MFESIVIWLLVIYFVVSFSEWFVHKYHMHRPGFLNFFDKELYSGHAKKHHVIFSPKSATPTQEHLDDIPHKVTDLLKVGFAYSIPILLLGTVFGSWEILIGIPLIFVTCVAWALTWNWLHVRIHEPNWKPSNRILKYLKEYHDGHHINPSKNYNSIALGFDWLMGTRKRA